MRSHSPTAERFGPTIAIKIGQTLREARAASGLSVHRVADETAISPQFLEAIESGTAVVTIQIIERIAEVVGWHWERLYSESAAHDHFVRAYEEVSEATAMCRTDVLGELYVACMKQAGSSRVPTAVLRASQRTVMFKSPRGVDRILDPACGSGARLIAAGTRDPRAELHGIDVDPDCVMMCALNMTFLRFRAVIQHRDCAVGRRRLAWNTSAGFIAELDANRQMAPARYGIALHVATRSNLETEKIRELGSSPYADRRAAARWRQTPPVFTRTLVTSIAKRGANVRS